MGITKSLPFLAVPLARWQASAALQGRLRLLVVPMVPQPVRVRGAVASWWEWPPGSGLKLRAPGSSHVIDLCPLGRAGDLLVGLEEWARVVHHEGGPVEHWYRADGEPDSRGVTFLESFRWWPAGDMDMDDSRITLRIGPTVKARTARSLIAPQLALTGVPHSHQVPSWEADWPSSLDLEFLQAFVDHTGIRPDTWVWAVGVETVERNLVTF